MFEGKTTQTQMIQVFGALDIVTECSSQDDILGFSPLPMIALASVGGGLSKSFIANPLHIVITCVSLSQFEDRQLAYTTRNIYYKTLIARLVTSSYLFKYARCFFPQSR